MSARFFDFLRVIPWDYPVRRGPLSRGLCALGFVTILLWKGLATPTANLVVQTLELKIEKCWISRKHEYKHGFTFCKKKLPQY